MANKKTSELDELHNIQDGDLVEITKYMGAGLGDGGGDYKSYKMTWLSLKAFFKYDEIVKIVFTAAQTYLYAADRYESIFKYVMISSEETAIRIGGNGDNELYLPQTTSKSGIIDIFAQSSISSEREIRIETYDSATVYLFVTKNLIP